MTRPDLIALTFEALVDLTNRGTVRRAQRELPGCGAVVSTGPDDDITVRTDDGVVCELPAGGGPGAWRCSCRAAECCRHLVRAVLAVQESSAATPGPQEAERTGPSGDMAPVAPGRPGDTEAAGPSGPATDVPPDEIGDDDLAAVVGLAALRRARALAEQGAVGQVGSAAGTTVVHIHHPVAVTVRFLPGGLAFARCSCPDPDPCRHVPLAALVVRGKVHARTGLRVVGEDRWRAPHELLDETAAAVRDLLAVGIETAHGRVEARWVRLEAHLRPAGLVHPADLVAEVLDQVEHYGERRDDYDPSHLVLLVAELLARCASLVATHPGRVPDRVVAGTPVPATRLGRSTLVGLGTSVSRVDHRWRVVAHVVDTRTGAPGRLVRHAPVADGPPPVAMPLAQVPLAVWGGGRVAVDGLRVDGAGDIDVRRRRAVGTAAPALTELPPPWLAADLTELATARDRVPALLGNRSAGAGLQVVRLARVVSRSLDRDGAMVATLADDRGGVAALRLARGPVPDLWEMLEPGPADELLVSGRWYGPAASPGVDPLLVVRDGAAVQPQLVDGGALVGHERADGVAADLSGVLDRALGRALVAGLDRLRADPLWRRLADDTAALGADRVAALAADLDDRGDPRDLERLLLVHAFALQGG